MNPFQLSLYSLVLLSSTLCGKPNVVIVITDDQGYGDLACHGNTIVQTPAMDQLYGESIRLTDYHVSPTCAPTRGALMSGHYTNRAGPWHTIMGRSFLRPESTTLGEVFSANGYRTGLFGKWHLGDNYPYRPIDRGFQEVVSHAAGGVGQTPDHWDNSYFGDTYMHNGQPRHYEGYCTDVYFSEAERFIGECIEADTPFLAYVSTNAPHSPFHCPESYWKPYIDQVSSLEEAIFYGMITNIDDNIARLRSFLADKGVANDTLFIFTTDNGTATGQRIYNAGMRGAKASEYDGGHRVPFFLHWPGAGLDQPLDITPLTAHIDILPTLIELCGLQGPRDYSFDGRSLAPLFFQNPVPWPDRTIITDSQRVKDPVKWRKSSTMTNRWRLVNGAELYDMHADPAQQQNVADAHPDVVSDLREDYEAWWTSVSTLFDRETRIVIGNDAENPMQLTCHDWITNDEVTPWHQGFIREAKPGTGFWALHVEEAGRYSISLRRWPLEVARPLTSGLPAGAAVSGLKAFREAPGVAIPVQFATLKAGDYQATQPLIPGSESITFTVDLPAGNLNLQGDFHYGENGTSTVGAYYAVITRIHDQPPGYPLFSWDRVPVYIHFGDADGYTDEAIAFMATRSAFVCMEKMQGFNVHGSVEKGQVVDAARLKALNPDIKVLFYWNTFLDYPRYDAHEVYQSQPDWWLRKLDGSLDKKNDTLRRYDLSNPDVREWWTDVLLDTVTTGPCDGVFMDAFPQVGSPANRRLWGDEKFEEIQNGLLETIRLTREKIGHDKLIMYNGIRNTDTLDFGRQYLDRADALTIEHFGHFHSSHPDSMARDLSGMIEAGKQGKIVVFKAWPGFSFIDKDIRKMPHETLIARARDNITFPLACFLVAAQRHAYFCYTWGYQESDGSLDWYPEFDRPLGPPLGDATVSGYQYTREFTHCRVSVNLETRAASIVWKEPSE